MLDAFLAKRQNDLTDSKCHSLHKYVPMFVHIFLITSNVLFLDIDKAFDSIWHQGLLYKSKNLVCPKYLISF